MRVLWKFTNNYISTTILFKNSPRKRLVGWVIKTWWTYFWKLATLLTKDEYNSMRLLTSYVVVNENVQNPQLLHAVKLFLQLMFKHFILQWNIFSPGVLFQDVVSHRQHCVAFLPKNLQIWAQIVHHTWQLYGFPFIHHNLFGLRHKFWISFVDDLLVSRGVKYLITLIGMVIVRIVLLIIVVLFIIEVVFTSSISNWAACNKILMNLWESMKHKVNIRAKN